MNCGVQDYTFCALDYLEYLLCVFQEEIYTVRKMEGRSGLHTCCFVVGKYFFDPSFLYLSPWICFSLSVHCVSSFVNQEARRGHKLLVFELICEVNYAAKVYPEN